MLRAIFLDRDGVLNQPVLRAGISTPPGNIGEFHILPGVLGACIRLKEAGFLLIVVTNQPDVARGSTAMASVEAINRELRASLPLDDVRVCYHDDGDGCSCRKPKPGLLLQASVDWKIDLGESFMVGDRWKDIEAGRRAGCRTIFVGEGVVPADNACPDHRAETLAEAAAWIISRHQSSGRGRVKSVYDLKVKLFADGADRTGIREMYANPLIKGFTTNPTLMRKAGITDYRTFASEILGIVKDRPVSFEVLADEFSEMKIQALEISSWGKNVVVKIPVTNTRGDSSANLLRCLAGLGVSVNVTALTTVEQVKVACECLGEGPASYVSVFAGRIADTGRDPIPVMAEAVNVLGKAPQLELIWASPRELLNIFQADSIGCHVITATNDILKKLSLIGKDLTTYSVETVKMFYEDAQKAGYSLSTGTMVK